MRCSGGEGTPDEQADRLLAAGVEIAVVKLGPEGVMAKTRTERVVSALCRWKPSMARVPGTPSAGLSAMACYPAGACPRFWITPTLPARLSPPACPALMRCRRRMRSPRCSRNAAGPSGSFPCRGPCARSTHVRRRSSPLNLNDDPRRYEHLSRIRLEDPEAVARAAATRRRHPGLKHGVQNFIVAADHPARGALSVGPEPMAMADRRDLLDRLQIALANPAVDGILASPDIMDDLLLLGALDGKLIFGSMNRGGTAGLVNEFDDRFTGHTAAALQALGADGGKMLTRICTGDPDTVATLEATAKAIDSLAERKLIAMVEPFLSVRDAHGKVRNDLRADAVIKSVGIAEGLVPPAPTPDETAGCG